MKCKDCKNRKGSGFRCEVLEKKLGLGYPHPRWLYPSDDFGCVLFEEKENDHE